MAPWPPRNESARSAATQGPKPDALVVVVVAVAVGLLAVLVLTVVVTVAMVELVVETEAEAVVLETVGLDPPQPESTNTPHTERTARKARIERLSAAQALDPSRRPAQEVANLGFIVGERQQIEVTGRDRPGR